MREKNATAIWGLVALGVLAGNSAAQTNKAQNFSFETAGVSPPAASWDHAWSGYERVPLTTGGWDGQYALRLTGKTANLSGAVQRIVFNQTVATPILITMRVRGENIQNLSGDKYGAALYCRVKRKSGVIDYCPTTAKTKNVDTFHWRYLGINTSTLLNGNQPVEWVEVVPVLGAVTGTAWFDDVHVAEYGPGLFRGAVTINPDDGFKEHFSIVYPALKSRGWCGSIAAVTNYLSSGDPGYMNWVELKEMRDNCWEVMSHGVGHLDMTAISKIEMENEFYWSKRRFNEMGFYPKSFALPFGSYNAEVIGLNEERSYFSSIRKVERSWNPMGSFPHDIKIQELKSDTTLEQVNGWLSEAAARKAWLVIVLHKVREVCPDAYCTTTYTFQNVLTAVGASTLPVVTYEEGLNLVKSPR